eukprot:gene8588-22010_t
MPKPSKYATRRVGRPKGAGDVPFSLKFFLSGVAAASMYPVSEYIGGSRTGPRAVTAIGMHGLKEWAADAVCGRPAGGCRRVMDGIYRVAGMPSLFDKVVAVPWRLRPRSPLIAPPG